MNIPNGVFDLTNDQLQTSKMMYNGKSIKCLVAPCHSYNDLKDVLPFTKTTFLFPEREMNNQQLTQFISLIVSNPGIDDVIIVTANQNIILDMVDACVRILTGDGEIVPCPIKTFMANIHDIRYSILENEAFMKKQPRPNNVNQTQVLLTELQALKFKTITPAEKERLKMKVEIIGEDIVRNILTNHLEDIYTN